MCDVVIFIVRVEIGLYSECGGLEINRDFAQNRSLQDIRVYNAWQ